MKQLLAKMLPEKIYAVSDGRLFKHYQLDIDGINKAVIDTELLQICWEIEEGLKNEAPFYSNKRDYYALLESKYATYGSSHATWQQRTIALAAVKQIEII